VQVFELHLGDAGQAHQAERIAQFGIEIAQHLGNALLAGSRRRSTAGPRRPLKFWY
jgi:hypothetical protein